MRRHEGRRIAHCQECSNPYSTRAKVPVLCPSCRATPFWSAKLPKKFAGTKTDQIKQIGNAVSVAKMKACVGAIMADAAPKRREKPADGTVEEDRKIA